MTDTVAPTPTGAEDILWDLSVLYSGPEDPALERDMQALIEDVGVFAAQYKGRAASMSAQEYVEALQTMERFYDRATRIGYFAYLSWVTDTLNPQLGALLQRSEEWQAQLQSDMVFFLLEWNALDDATAQPILDDPALGRYHHTLEAERRYRPYQLSEAEEKILIVKDVTGSSAWQRLFSQLNASLRLPFGDETLTLTQVLAKMHDADRDMRRRASEAVTAVLQGRSMELTYIFNTLLADKATDDKLRGYPHWIASRNLANKAPDAVVEALISAVTASYDLVARHYTLKRKLLGLDELTEYDRYAPLPLKTGDKRFTWAEARDIVQNAYHAFSADMAGISARFFDDRWIHAPVLPTKRGGAFAASGSSSTHPFVLVNFTGRTRDVSTLAHELGHGVHQVLAAAHGEFNASTPLTTSEMASVFGEMLVFQDLMAHEPDAEARLAMLVEKIEDTFATVYRQTAMNRFEDAMHTARREQGELSTEQFTNLWLRTQRAMFGDSVALSDAYGIWWSYIPHFLNTPGYVYAYAFGELLVLALYQLYQERGADFVPQYMDVLAAGGSDYPDRILARVGVDLNDPAFWSKGIDAIRALVEQEEALARELYPDKF